MLMRLPSLLSIVVLSVCVPLASGQEPSDAAPPKAAAKESKAPAAAVPKSTPAEPTPAGSATADRKPDGAAPAPVPSSRKRKLMVKPSLVAAIAERGGRVTLAIHYPWKVHDKASVEVRLVAGQRAEGTTVVPVNFQSEFCKGPILLKVYRCLDHATDQETTESFTKDKMVYQIIGQRNSLGRPSVHVLPYNEGGTPDERPGAVFLQLDTWAINDRMLSLDLSRHVFAKSGKLFVWFLRGDKVIWEEKIDWPGYKTAE